MKFYDGLDPSWTSSLGSNSIVVQLTLTIATAENSALIPKLFIFSWNRTLFNECCFVMTETPQKIILQRFVCWVIWHTRVALWLKIISRANFACSSSWKLRFFSKLWIKGPNFCRLAFEKICARSATTSFCDRWAVFSMTPSVPVDPKSLGLQILLWDPTDWSRRLFDSPDPGNILWGRTPPSNKCKRSPVSSRSILSRRRPLVFWSSTACARSTTPRQRTMPTGPSTRRSLSLRRSAGSFSSRRARVPRSVSGLPFSDLSLRSWSWTIRRTRRRRAATSSTTGSIWASLWERRRTRFFLSLTFRLHSKLECEFVLN